MLDARLASALLQAVPARAHLLLVGDTKQHTSVEAGDALRCLQEFARVPVVHLTEIRRQKDPEYRKAVARLARGDGDVPFTIRWQPIQVLPAGIPGSGALLAPLWQYRQFMPAFSTCGACTNLTGCSTRNPCDVDAPLYADNSAAAAANARKPGITVHFFLTVMYLGREGE